MIKSWTFTQKAALSLSLSLSLPCLLCTAAQALPRAPEGPRAGQADATARHAEVEWIRTPRPRVSLADPRAGSGLPSAPLAALRAEAAAEWTVHLDDVTFHQTLRRWTQEAGWQLVWEADRDFPIDAQVTLQGNFLHALDQAMAALRETDYPIQARINPETRVVRVVRYLLDGERR